MIQSLPLNTSYKHQFIVGCIISIWLVLFLVLIAPFDAGDLNFEIRVQILPFYGVITFFSYIILIPIQNIIFNVKKTWNIVYEVLFLVFFNALSFTGSYIYYKTPIINGEYDIRTFAFEVYVPILVILLAVIIFSRWFLNNKVPHKMNKKSVLTGENKFDILQLNLSNLICASSADNYVEIFYLRKGKLQKRLLRNTLKNISEQEPELVRVHRSHLINPSHFKEWKDSNTLALSEVEVPISKNFKQAFIKAGHSPLKANDSSQSS